jgi:hypothetical protein
VEALNNTSTEESTLSVTITVKEGYSLSLLLALAADPRIETVEVTA